MKRKNLQRLDNNVLVYVLSFLGPRGLSSWFSLACTSREFKCLAYVTVAIQVGRNIQFHDKVVSGWKKQISVVRHELQHSAQAKYFSFFMGRDLLNKIYKKYSDEEIAHAAIVKYSVADIEALGKNGFDFVTSGFLFKAVNFQKNSDEAEFVNRYKIFFAMLQYGAFPKEGAKAFLQKLDSRLQLMAPALCDPFGPFPMSPEQLAAGVEDLENWDILTKAYPDFRKGIADALAQFAPEHARVCRWIKKLNRRNSRSEVAEGKELLSYRR